MLTFLKHSVVCCQQSSKLNELRGSIDQSIKSINQSINQSINYLINQNKQASKQAKKKQQASKTPCFHFILLQIQNALKAEKHKFIHILQQNV